MRRTNQRDLHLLQNREWLLNTFEYSNGRLTRKTTGKRAGTDSSPYRLIGVNGVQCLEHRVIWVMFNGFLPPVVDHINRIKNDNRIENLRASTKQRNESNSEARENNSTGYKGIRRHSTNNSYTAQLNVGKVQIYLSSEKSPEDAATVYNFAAYEWYGEYVLLNEVNQDWL